MEFPFCGGRLWRSDFRQHLHHNQTRGGANLAFGFVRVVLSHFQMAKGIIKNSAVAQREEEMEEEEVEVFLPQSV